MRVVLGRDWLEALWRRSLSSVQGDSLVEEVLSEHLLALHSGRWNVVAVGKAASSMAAGAAPFFLEAGGFGCVITKDGHGPAPVGWSLREASHPIPDLRSLEAADWFLKQVDRMQTDDRLLFLISGGASSLLTAPVEGLSLTEKARLGQALVNSGANIHDINCVRKHLSRIKGGGLLRRLPPGRGLTLAMSDVVGDRPESIGSGPSVTDPSTFEEAVEVMEQAHLSATFPRIMNILKEGCAGQRPETLKPSAKWETVMPFQCLGSNRQILEVIQQQAERDLDVVLIDDPIDRPLDDVVEQVIQQIIEIRSRSCPVLILLGGEPTLEVDREGGAGGRMQHLALCVAMAMEHSPGLWVLAAGSDGTDGPTDAAGAIVDGLTVSQGLLVGVDAQTALRSFDSYRFHCMAGTSLKTGPTGTHLGDVVMILWSP